MPVALRVWLRNSKRVRRAVVKRFANLLLHAVGESGSEFGIELVGDCRMRRLNRRYRGNDSSTDVLAFSIREGSGPVSSLIGDVVVSIPAAARQARAHRHSEDEELAVLLIHGLLHLCGYDHERGEKEAARMRRRERLLLERARPLPRLLRRR
jgi:probable rRNA maturation factor